MKKLFLIALLFAAPMADAQLITRVQLIPLSNYVDMVWAFAQGSSNYFFNQVTNAVRVEAGTNVHVEVDGTTTPHVMAYRINATGSGGSGSATNFHAGWRVAFITDPTDTNSITVVATNRTLVQATASSLKLDYASTNYDSYALTNLSEDTTLYLTNLVQGRDIWVSFITDGNERMVNVVTNGLTAPIRISWGNGSATNSLGFAVQNRARLNVAYQVPGEVAAAYELQDGSTNAGTTFYVTNSYTNIMTFSIKTNGTYVVTSATNLNFIAGSNILVLTTNASGDVSMEIRSLASSNLTTNGIDTLSMNSYTADHTVTTNGASAATFTATGPGTNTFGQSIVTNLTATFIVGDTNNGLQVANSNGTVMFFYVNTNGSVFIGGTNVLQAIANLNSLSNLLGIVYQNPSVVLSNLAALGITNLIAGYGLALTTNSGQATIFETNRVSVLASNSTTVQIDFSDATVNRYEITNLNANITLNLTNVTYGVDKWVYIRTDGVSRTVTVVTNGMTSQTRISWGFASTTNGATSFTCTNRARLNLACIPVGEVAAAYENQN